MRRQWLVIALVLAVMMHTHAAPVDGTAGQANLAIEDPSRLSGWDAVEAKWKAKYEAELNDLHTNPERAVERHLSDEFDRRLNGATDTPDLDAAYETSIQEIQAQLAASTEAQLLQASTTAEGGGDAGKDKNEEKRRCVFIHGAAWGGGGDKILTDRSKDKYWNIPSDAGFSKCSSWAFMNEDTLNQAWFDKPLYQAACRVALGDAQDKTIRNTAVFSHSAGTAILASGILNGECDFDKATTSWNVIGSGFRSQKNGDGAFGRWYELLSKYPVMADNIHWIMKKWGGTSGLYDPNTSPKERKIARMWLCMFVSRSAENRHLCAGHPGEDHPEKIEQIVQSRSSGAMCGTSVLGAFRKKGGLGEWLAGQADKVLWPDPEPNDGIVSTYGCLKLAPEGCSPSDQPSSRCYTASMSHTELTGPKQGDPSDEKPLMWMANMIIPPK